MTMVENPTWTLAERLRRSRLLAGLDQREIAERLGIARQTVSLWEIGKTEPSATNFVRWAEETGQPLEWLAEGVKCARRDSNPQPSDP
jgi:transcriptional regulator with XRE-family HTH domain